MWLKEQFSSRKIAIDLGDSDENTRSTGCPLYLGTVSWMKLEVLTLNVLENALRWNAITG